MASTPAPREHYWDTLRACAMLLGIPYHVALCYRVGQDWIVRTGEGVPGMALLAELIHLFRMPTFFTIAGYFAAMLLARRAPGTWLRGRVKRLGLPFIATILTLVPLLNLACEFSTLPYAEALRSFRNNSLTSGGYWVRHLWFIIVLLYCSALAAGLVRLVPALTQWRLAPATDALLARHLPVTLLATAIVIGLWQGAAVEAFWDWGFATNLYQQILRIDEFIAYLPWFVLGCLLQRMPAVQARFGQVSPAMVALALAGTVASVLWGQAVHPATGRFIATFAALGWTQVLVAAARTWFDRPSRPVQAVTEAAFVIYLFHMPIAIWLAWLGTAVPVSPWIKVLAVNALTLALSWGAWLVIRRVGALSLAFNGVRGPLPLHRSGLTATP
ncbi:acyltransferase family protein [Croceibacterium sp. TMG7-5b_MA50]|uniref:acyltransferase family protein n=1 Tax=Croceibacterium sp. TMG7-5b_MA50 TaxID=3121290 RepID=UPI003221580E